MGSKMENIMGEIFAVKLLKPFLRCCGLEASNKCWCSSPCWVGVEPGEQLQPVPCPFSHPKTKGLDQSFRHSC